MIDSHLDLIATILSQDEENRRGTLYSIRTQRMSVFSADNVLSQSARILEEANSSERRNSRLTDFQNMHLNGYVNENLALEEDKPRTGRRLTFFGEKLENDIDFSKNKSGSSHDKIDSKSNDDENLEALIQNEKSILFIFVYNFFSIKKLFEYK